jgi:hypothetical protein
VTAALWLVLSFVSPALAQQEGGAPDVEAAPVTEAEAAPVAEAAPEFEPPPAPVAEAAPGFEPPPAPAAETAIAGDEGAPIEEEEEEEEEEGDVLYATAGGEYQLRGNYLSDIPLRALPREPASDSLGQNGWLGQWFRLRGEGGLRGRLTLHGEIDLFDGLVFGDFTRGVSTAEHARDDATAFPGVQPRALYLEWMTPVGLLRGGLMTSHWGLGLLANDGAHEPVFGDIDYGDVVTRVAFATKPFGRRVPFFVALTGDLVYDDITAQIVDGDVALQGALAFFYQQGERTVGAYGVVRSQRTEIDGGVATFDEETDIFAADVFARWDFADQSGGRYFGAFETAVVLGTTTATRTLTRDEHEIRQFLAAAQIGRVHDRVDVILEGGYASGDSNAEDEVQRRATMDPAHKVGLILFPEVLAWQSARSAALAGSDVLSARDAPGSDRLPTNGGVSNAIYLYPHAIIRLSRPFELRLGAVWARTATHHVDPYAQRALSSNQNPLGGDPRAHDLGLELDGAFLWRGRLARGVRLNAGIEGGILLPGHAFDDAAGDTMDAVGLARARFGISF